MSEAVVVEAESLSSERDVLGMGRRVLEKERDGLSAVLGLLDDSFVRAVETVLNCSGRVAVTGMGKAGLIGAKVAATLSSTGSPAYVLHPVEAIHGDLGMVCRDDVALALSNSGESEEVLKVIRLLQDCGCRVILITSHTQSRCAGRSDIVLSIGAQEEACPLGMAPSSSTTAMLALGDALALTVSEMKGFDRQRYAAVHPGGALGRSFMRVEEVMRTGTNCPTVQMAQTVQDYVELVLAAPLRAGAAVVVGEDRRLVGIFTHGDLGRLLSRAPRPGDCRLADVMTREPKRVVVGDFVSRALEVMRQHRVDEVPVVDAEQKVVGLIDIQDLLAGGFSLFDPG